MLLFIVLVCLIAISVGLAWFLITHDRGEKEPVNALWLAVGMGFVGSFGAVALELLLLPDKLMAPHAALAGMFIATLGVGIIEEGCKFIPLARIIYSKRYFNEHTDGVIYFALAGLGFGLPENLLYTLQFGAGAGIGRIFLTPFFHAATTGMVGYFLAKRKLAGKSGSGIWLPLVGAMILHGVYDFGLMSGVVALAILSVLITISMSALLFILFQKATQKDQDRGLSVVGNNSFCRSCGAPNPQGNLYCSRCGKNA